MRHHSKSDKRRAAPRARSCDYVLLGLAYVVAFVGLLMASNPYWPRSAPEACVQQLAVHPGQDGSVSVASGGQGPANFTCCLAMIIKNEGPIMPRLFESVKGFASEYCIVDTGSTDDTIDVVKSMDMPGVVFEEPFVDFATTRNYMLDRCREASTADYLLLLDADMVLRASPEWDWAKLDGKDVYNLIQVWGVEYENVRLVRREAAARIRVVGSTHEYYDVPTEFSKGLLPKQLVYIDDVGDGKAKSDKFERDERLLRKDLAADPENGRAVFYLGNTLRSLQRHEEAIECYLKRTGMGGWFADRDYSIYQASGCFLALGRVDEARRYAEMAAFDGAAPRAEPLYDLAFYLHQRGNHSLAWYYTNLAARIAKPHVTHALFISNDIYDYWLTYERATLCRHVLGAGQPACLLASMDFLNNAHAPEHLRAHFVHYDLGLQVGPLPGEDDALVGAAGERVDADGCAPHRPEETGTGWRQSLFAMNNATYCVQQWFPLAVGQYPSTDNATMGCLPQVWSPDTPRALSLVTSAAVGIQIGEEVWLPVRWPSSGPTTTEQSSAMFSFVVLRSNGRFKAHTVPFSIGRASADGEDGGHSQDIVSVGVSGDAQAIEITYKDASAGGGCRLRTHRARLMDMYALVVR